MDTLRVNICYRPLRIGWAIKSDDFVAFRKAVRYSNALWGGRFNPILFVDTEFESSQLVNLFRLDFIFPIGNIDKDDSFLKKHSHLIKPFLHDSIFMEGDEHSDPWANVLDIHNALAYFRDRQEWKDLKGQGIYLHTWDDDDPLADVLLCQLGEYPGEEEVDRNYLDLLNSYTESTEIILESDKPIPDTVINHPGISFLSRYGLERHYSLDSHWRYPGFYIGDSASLEDVVCHWNLRACDVSLWFIDPQYLERYTEIIPNWESKAKHIASRRRHKWDKNVAIWTRSEEINTTRLPFQNSEMIHCHATGTLWNGQNIQAPMMYMGEASVLGVISNEGTKPKVSFALSEKPFCGDIWFHQQKLVASVSFIGGLFGDEQHTFHAPYVPELNEFYARVMHLEYNKLRVEPERIGIVIDAAEHDSFLYALPVHSFMERLFKLSGYQAEFSQAGLITKQLINRLGGLQGGRVFKIPGVRRLIKTHGLKSSITKKTALQAIGSKDPDRPDTSFADHSDLHIEPRERGEQLTPDSVFGYLVEKGLYRIGVDLDCTSCQMKSWIPLDVLKHEVVCSLCGHAYEVARNLTDINQWHYRRSGILGVEKNTQGAIPVLLTLQQLDTNLHGDFHKRMYSPSLNLTSDCKQINTICETDFVWIIPRAYPKKSDVILAECKDQGSITADDIQNLKKIAESLPKDRFRTFVLLSKISKFTKSEIEIAKLLNDQFNRRAILLSAKELEQYYIGMQETAKDRRQLRWSTPGEMANSTHQLYFNQDDVSGD